MYRRKLQFFVSQILYALLALTRKSITPTLGTVPNITIVKMEGLWNFPVLQVSFSTLRKKFVISRRMYSAVSKLFILFPLINTDLQVYIVFVLPLTPKPPPLQLTTAKSPTKSLGMILHECYALFLNKWLFWGKFYVILDI